MILTLIMEERGFRMFQVGDKIVYPMHGAGVIDKVETKKVLGELREYYVLSVQCSTVNIMVPVDSCEKIGVRHIIASDEIPSVFELLRAESTDMERNWNRRFRENMEKLKTGDVLQVAEVVRNLWRNDKIKKLSAGEKNMLNNARNILTSEIALVTESPLAEIEEKVEASIFER